MCLERKIVKELPEAMIAYKYVERHVRYCDEIFDSVVMFNKQQRVRVRLGGGWGWNGNDYDTYFCDFSEYPAGVHAWPSLEDAKAFSSLNSEWRDRAIVKVLLRGPLACGIQSRREVVVYKEMTILEVIECED